jgi:hypothetical protein
MRRHLVALNDTHHVSNHLFPSQRLRSLSLATHSHLRVCFFPRRLLLWTLGREARSHSISSCILHYCRYGALQRRLRPLTASLQWQNIARLHQLGTSKSPSARELDMLRGDKIAEACFVSSPHFARALVAPIGPKGRRHQPDHDPCIRIR